MLHHARSRDQVIRCHLLERHQLDRDGIAALHVQTRAGCDQRLHVGEDFIAHGRRVRSRRIQTQRLLVEQNRDGDPLDLPRQFLDFGAGLVDFIGDVFRRVLGSVRAAAGGSPLAFLRKVAGHRQRAAAATAGLAHVTCRPATDDFRLRVERHGRNALAFAADINRNGHARIPGADAGFQQAGDLLLQRACLVFCCGTRLGRFVRIRAGQDALGRIDDGHVFGLQTGYSQCDEILDRLSLPLGQGMRRCQRHGGRLGRLRARKAGPQARADMHARRRDAGNREDGPRQLAFLRTPVRSVVHLGRDREAIHLIEQFIPLHRLAWQAFLGERKAHRIALAFRNEDRAALNLVFDAALVEFLDDLAGILRLEAGIQQRHGFLGRALHHEAHGKHNPQHRSPKQELTRQGQGS